MKDVILDPTATLAKHSTATPTKTTTAASSPTTATPTPPPILINSHNHHHRPSLLASAGKVEPIRRSSLPMKKRKSFQIEPIPPPMLSAADIKECGLSDDDDDVDDGMDDGDYTNANGNGCSNKEQKEQKQQQVGNHSGISSRPSKRRASHGFGLSPSASASAAATVTSSSPMPLAASTSASTSTIEEEEEDNNNGLPLPLPLTTITPQINDVLISSSTSSTNNNTTTNTNNNQSSNNNQSTSSSSTFNHIGNRRFRVLVEANLSKYFGHLTTPQEWEAALSTNINNNTNININSSNKGGGKGVDDNNNKKSSRGQYYNNYTAKQTQVVQAVIESVKGNVPSGRFLLQLRNSSTPTTTNDDSDDVSNTQTNKEGRGEEKEYCKTTTTTPQRLLLLRLATLEEITTKVHLTFTAAGRFHVMQNYNAALLMDMQQQQQQQQQQQLEQEQDQQQVQDITQQQVQDNNQEDAPISISQQQTMVKKESTSSSSSTSKTALITAKKKKRDYQLTSQSMNSNISQASTSTSNASCASGLCGNVLSQRGLNQLAARAAEAAREQYDAGREERERDGDMVVAKAMSLQKMNDGMVKGVGGGDEAVEGELQMEVEPTSSSSSSDLEDDENDDEEEEGVEEEESHRMAASASKEEKEEEDCMMVNTREETLNRKKKALLLNKPASASASSEGALKGSDALLLQAAATSRRKRESFTENNNSSSSSNNKLDFLLAQAAKLNNGNTNNNNVAKYLPARQGGGGGSTTRRNNNTMGTSSSSSTTTTSTTTTTATAESLLAATSGEGLIHQSRLEKKSKRFVPTSIDELFKAAAEAAKTSSMDTVQSFSTPVGAVAVAVASGTPSSDTSSPQDSSSSSEEGGSSSCISPSFPLVSGLLSSSATKRRGSQGDSMMLGEQASIAGMPLLACPARIKVFLSLPMDKFFVEEEDCSNNAIMDTSSHAVPPTVAPSSYMVPSNYDILCGPGQSFFHHIGNRRFRIMIEMNAHRYEHAYLSSLSNNNNGTNSTTTSSGGILEDGPIQRLIDEILASLSKCDPAGRFLGMEMSTGRWRVLNYIFCRLKIEQTFFECVQVKQRRQAREQQEEQHVLQQQQQLEMGQQEEEEEWTCRVEQEKDMLLAELNSRMGVAGAAGIGNSNNNTIDQLAVMALASQQRTNGTQPLSQAPASDGNIMSLLDSKTEENGGELSSLQSRAKASLRRRQFQASVQQSMGQLMTSSNEDPRTLEKIVAMSEMVRAIREQQQTPRSLMESFRNNSAVDNSMGAQQQLRRSSLPVLSGSSSLGLGASSFTSTLSNLGSLNGGQGPFSVVPHQQHRGSILSRDSNDSLQSMSGQVMEHGSRTQPQQTTVPGMSPHANTSSPSNKDLLDVVGGMMMMSRRGSC